MGVEAWCIFHFPFSIFHLTVIGVVSVSSNSVDASVFAIGQSPVVWEAAQRRGRRSRIGFRQNCVCRRHLRT